MSVAVLSPHLDDAVLSAWSVLRRPGAVTVVNVCAGIPPPGPPPRWDRLTGARDAAERVRERRAEDRVALARAGREGVHLDFLDAQYRDGPLDDEELERALAEATPGAAELWAPAGIGAHRDHVQVRDAALRLAQARRAELRLYAELPYAARWGWPEWVTGRRRRDGLDVDGWLCDFLPGDRDLAGERHPLGWIEVRRKARAIRDYATQRAALDAWSGRSLMRPRELRYEASFAPAPVSTPAPSAPAR